MRKIEKAFSRCEELEARQLSELTNSGADHQELARQGVRADLMEAAGQSDKGEATYND